MFPKNKDIFLYNYREMIKIRKLILLQDYYLIYRSFLILPVILSLRPKHSERA